MSWDDGGGDVTFEIPNEGMHDKRCGTLSWASICTMATGCTARACKKGRHVHCHEGVARSLVFVMLRGKAENKNHLFFYTQNHELSFPPFLTDVNVMPEPRWGRSYSKGWLVVVGGGGGIWGDILDGLGSDWGSD